jgi:hypothetical protein
MTSETLALPGLSSATNCGISRPGRKQILYFSCGRKKGFVFIGYFLPCRT